jgi:hypothetical protein
VTLAHPVSGHPHVDIPLALTAMVGALAVFVVAVAWPARQRPPAGPVRAPASWCGSLSTGQTVVRVAAVALLMLATAAGRAGLDDQLENLAPALVVGVAWPLLVLASVCVGAVWRWVDPWDGIARVLVRDPAPPDDGAAAQPASVWPAVLVAVPVVWYVGAYTDPLDPRAVGLATAVYTLFTVGGCVAAGRRRWLGASEPLGIVLSWMALVPRGRLADWDPPRGAEALLGVLAGGALFGAVRRSEVWSGLNRHPAALLWATLGMLAFAVVLAAFLLAMGRLSEPLGARAGVARAVVPAVAAVTVAVALERNRWFTSAQLLPGLLGDPFGRGWDILGPAVDGLDPAPLGAAGLLWLQLGLLLAGHLTGAVLVARRLQERSRLPAAVVLLHLMGGSVVAVAMH